MSPLRRTLTAGLSAGLVLAGASLAGAQAIPGLPPGVQLPPGVKLPKVTQFNATLDTAGYIEVRQLRDNTQECAPGRDTLVENEALFELGRPRPVKVSVINGLVTSTFGNNPGGAIHRSTLISHSETNWCPPIERAPEIGPPDCRARIVGKLRAYLTPTPSPALGGDEPAPLVNPVSLVLQRLGGGNQKLPCVDFQQTLRPRVGDHVLDLLEVDKISVIVPIGITDRQVLALKKGKVLRRSIRLNGACDRVIITNGSATAADLNAIEENCTVKGRIYVQLKRT